MRDTTDRIDRATDATISDRVADHIVVSAAATHTQKAGQSPPGSWEVDRRCRRLIEPAIRNPTEGGVGRAILQIAHELWRSSFEGNL